MRGLWALVLASAGLLCLYLDVGEKLGGKLSLYRAATAVSMYLTATSTSNVLQTVLLEHFHYLKDDAQHRDRRLDSPSWDEPEGVAVLVELSRQCSGFQGTVQNIMGNIPTSWALQVFHGQDNYDFIAGHRAFKELRASGRVHMSHVDWGIDPDANSLGYRDGRDLYNRLLTSEKFWLRVMSENVLLFQTDTRLCSNSQRSIHDFEGYDYVGAPWQPGNALNLKSGIQLRVGNGGLSYRKRAAMLDVVRNRDAIRMALQQMDTPHSKAAAEDVFFIYGLWWLNENHNCSYNVPDIDVASTFAMEAGDPEFTELNGGDVFGVHQLPGGESSCAVRTAMILGSPVGAVLVHTSCEAGGNR
ncbi:hypothetical protein JKP88DRAFT_255315 [Tribonema minus]|uniref:DUF5672 domain-containing protein n=1 Tax=Tribonema minus TaxID=303371 RepID=A0A835Z0I9_9STRA|nr:hypothetical protein JKP88DRAFT_255315 [Tribonema minus]